MGLPFKLRQWIVILICFNLVSSLIRYLPAEIPLLADSECEFCIALTSRLIVKSSFKNALKSSHTTGQVQDWWLELSNMTSSKWNPFISGQQFGYCHYCKYDHRASLGVRTEFFCGSLIPCYVRFCASIVYIIFAVTLRKTYFWIYTTTIELWQMDGLRLY